MNFIAIIREINYMISVANAVRAEKPDDKDAWSFALTNRSFLVPFFGFLLSICILTDVPFLVPLRTFIETHGPDALADNIILAITLVTGSWGGLERLMGNTRAVWNLTQAKKAVEEAYAVMDTDKAKLQKAIQQVTGR